MADVFVGKYKLSKSDNFDEFLSELGIGMIKRKLAQSTKPEIEVSKDGDMWHVKTKSALKNTEVKFKIGEEFEEVRQDDVKVKSLVVQDGNKWTQTQTPLDSDKVVTIVREFGDKTLTTTASVGNVTSVRVYDRL